MANSSSSSSSCYLQVDVNGEEVFFVNKEILLSFSGKLRNLFGKSSGKGNNLKVIFHDLPGGAKGFELMAKFCYNNGKTVISPSNVVVLHCVAFFMEMNKDVSGAQNLIEKTEVSLKEIGYWSWSELIEALKQCQNSVVGRLVSASDESASTASPDSSGFRFSCDTKSTESFKNCYARTNWWFDDLVVLNPEWIERVVKSMIFLKFDHGVISRFLLYYQKTRFTGVTLEVKGKIMETVIDLLSSLDHSSVPYKSLFGILRVTLGLNISKSCRNKLESMIGSQLDQATMDNLLVPSPPGVNFLYDVNLVIRFLKSFLLGGTSWVSSTRLKKVAKIIDLYIAEVAPDPCLKPSKFVALIMALPDSARDCYDDIYQSMDMYLEVHVGLSEEEKTMICSALNYEKLSLEACKHLAQNSKFPATTAVQLLSTQQSKLKSLLQETSDPIYSSELSCTYSEKSYKDKDIGHIVHYAKNLDLSTENEKLKENLQGMQWRVMELEKVCRKMQNQMAKIINSKASTTPSTPRSLPRMCS
ncbi:hypothetical protein AQUCO_01200255v1 [Aquilegia coerulea]|uniref:NPH3 domain-containing protein n=1 Tax=Aquilegia coerulea TaxID=218851 RepID=A0A2G5E4Z5_AQUCA|nr:hypothetical protein AQUCO_01200255v1 [Aquilegia coerulea]